MRSSFVSGRGRRSVWIILSATACSSGGEPDPGPTEPPPDVRVTVSPPAASIDALQDTVRLTASVQNASGSPSVNWSTLDPSVASVAGGLVTAVANGTARVVASVSGKSDTATITVQQVAATIVVSPDTAALLIGNSAQLTGDVRDRKSIAMTGSAPAWTSLQPAIASVSANGMVTALSSGTASIEATAGAARDTATVIVAMAPLAITSDTSVTGTIVTGGLTITQGVKVTVTGDLTITASGDVTIAGTLEGDCRSVRIESAQALTITGTVRNTCTGADPVAPLTLIGRGEYDLDGAVVESSGEVRLTNDPTLTDADFPEPAGQVTAAARTAREFAGTPDRLTIDGQEECRLRAAQLYALPEKAADGAAGIIGQPGVSAKPWTVECNGFLKARGQLTFRGQHGGHGGMGTHNPSSGPADARGGLGGAGGRLRIRATGVVIFEGPQNELRGGDGGRGGDADATAGADPQGLTAPRADALAGSGGEPGLVTIRANTRIEFNNPTTLHLGIGGDGGHATAMGAPGADALGPTTPAQHGGAAFAWAGNGGGTPILLLAPTGLFIVQPENALVDGGHGGHGGFASSTGGKGGNGVLENADGGDGGSAEARPGAGGPARLLNHFAQLFGTGGDAGDGFLLGSKGGNGAAQCNLPVSFGLGGIGGNGGDLTGVHANGGIGLAEGLPGFIRLENAGNGGNGGVGEPGGPGGAGGARSFLATVSEVGSNTRPGSQALDCISGFGSFTSVSVGSFAPDPCPTLAFNGQITSWSSGPVTYDIAESIPSFGPLQTSGVLLPAPAATTPWSQTLVPYNQDLCTMSKGGPIVEGDVTITFNLGPKSVIKTFHVKYEFKPS